MSERREEFCTNSRRWIIWMTALGRIPKTCPHNNRGGGCIGSDCGYYEQRKPTAAFLRKERGVRQMFGTAEDEPCDES